MKIKAQQKIRKIGIFVLRSNVKTVFLLGFSSFDYDFRLVLQLHQLHPVLCFSVFISILILKFNSHEKFESYYHTKFGNSLSKNAQFFTFHSP